MDHILENRLDIVSKTETWLSPNVVSEFEKHGYYFHHRSRCFEKEGRVAVLLRNNFNARSCDDFVAKSIESIALLITTFSCTIRWVVIYRIPPSKENKLTKTHFMK